MKSFHSHLLLLAVTFTLPLAHPSAHADTRSTTQTPTTLSSTSSPTTSSPTTSKDLTTSRITTGPAILDTSSDVHAPIKHLPNPASVSFVDVTANGLDLPAKLFIPEGTGPYPAVIVLHGSGGLWADDDPDAGIMNPHFEEWGSRFQQLGYVSLFIDSYSPRGIVEFANRRPSSIPELSDAACSPTHTRPQDAYAALDYLRSSAPVAVEWSRVGLMGFSHGAESALASVVDKSVVDGKVGDWTTSFVYIEDGSMKTNFNHVTTAPSYPIPNGWGFACVVAYYPGCGFYGYFGKTSQAATANQYMPYAPTLLFHGEADELFDHAGKFVDRSLLHSLLLNLPANPLVHVTYEGAGHSFDEATEAEPEDWTARQSAQQETLLFLQTWLKD